jgi:ceramide glucosyltransferase
MDFVSVTPFISVAWWALSLAILLGSAALAALEPWLRRSPAKKNELPLSVIVPVKESAPELEPALQSLLSQSYSNFEVLVSATDESAPAIAQARNIAAQYPRVPVRFIARDPHAAANPKINNLALPIAEAKHDLIVVKDATIRLRDGRLAEMAGRFIGETGLVVSVPVGIKPESFAAEVECTAMNGYVARFLLAASALGMGFGIGATMLFSRRDFERAGGIAKIAQAVGEDHAVSKMLAAIGRKTVIEGTVEQIAGNRKMSEVWNRQLRWAVCRRCEEPGIFYAELGFSPLIASLAGAAGAATIGAEPAAVFGGTIAAWIAADCLLSAAKGWPLSWRSPFAALCFIFGFPLIWLQARFVRRIFWGDVSFAVERPAKNAGTL